MTKLQPPDWICDRAKDVFNEIVQQMDKHVVPTDLSLIADFAEAQADVERLTGQMLLEGETIEGKNGLYINPMYNVLSGRRKDLERFRHDLNLTPRLRGAVTKTTKTSALDSAMKKHTARKPDDE